MLELLEVELRVIQVAKVAVVGVLEVEEHSLQVVLPLVAVGMERPVL